MIVQALNEIQDRYGYLPERELRSLSARVGVPLHRLHEVASFFPHYRLVAPTQVDLKVCRDLACHLHGAARLKRSVEELAREVGGRQISVDGVSCLGQCDHAPAFLLNDHPHHGKSESELRWMIRDHLAGKVVPEHPEDRTALGWKIDPYGGTPRYDAVRRLVESSDANDVLKALEESTLAGLGGAGFPTFRKWDAVRKAKGKPKFVVCNADESEPGTFKDRELLRRAPHLVIEGMILAGLVAGAEQGYLYIRHEYHDEIHALRDAITEARDHGLRIGDESGQLMESDRRFRLELFISPGGYICGEETALLEAMEDRRAEPRNKPPFPVEVGLRGKPTILNNVETLSWTPGIVLNGGAWYRDFGMNGASGMRFVSISGDVNRPGVYEVPFGLPVRTLIHELAGGMREGQQLKAIAPSGPSGGFLPAQVQAKNLPKPFLDQRVPAGRDSYDILDLPLDNQSLRMIGSMLGAAFFVIGDQSDMVEMALNCTEFYRNESCGKCVPCRLGTQTLVDLIQRLLASELEREGLDGVTDLEWAMSQASICGLGMIAANPLVTVMKHFPDDVDKHLKGKRALVKS